MYYVSILSLTLCLGEEKPSQTLLCIPCVSWRGSSGCWGNISVSLTILCVFPDEPNSYCPCALCVGPTLMWHSIVPYYPSIHCLQETVIMVMACLLMCNEASSLGEEVGIHPMAQPFPSSDGSCNGVTFLLKWWQWWKPGCVCMSGSELLYNPCVNNNEQAEKWEHGCVLRQAVHACIYVCGYCVSGVWSCPMADILPNSTISVTYCREEAKP